MKSLVYISQVDHAYLDIYVYLFVSLVYLLQ